MKLEFKPEDFEIDHEGRIPLNSTQACEMANAKLVEWGVLKKACSHERMSYGLVGVLPQALCRDCGAKFEAVSWKEI